MRKAPVADLDAKIEDAVARRNTLAMAMLGFEGEAMRAAFVTMTDFANEIATLVVARDVRIREPERATMISQTRMGDLARGIAGMARTIGQHLADREAALADIIGLQERLCQAMALAHAALEAAAEATLPAGPLQEGYLDRALMQYRAARRLAARGPEAK